MKIYVAVAVVAIAAAAPRIASAQTVDQLVADHALLNAELERCKQLGMASVDDARCKTARLAENRRFFGGGTHYTPSTPYTTPGEKAPDTGSPLPPSSKPRDG